LPRRPDGVWQRGFEADGADLLIVPDDRSGEREKAVVEGMAVSGQTRRGHRRGRPVTGVGGEQRAVIGMDTGGENGWNDLDAAQDVGRIGRIVKADRRPAVVGENLGVTAKVTHHGASQVVPFPRDEDDARYRESRDAGKHDDRHQLVLDGQIADERPRSRPSFLDSRVRVAARCHPVPRHAWAGGFLRIVTSVILLPVTGFIGVSSCLPGALGYGPGFPVSGAVTLVFSSP